MLKIFTALIIISFINPADPTGKTMYSSGVKDVDKFIFTAPPSIKNPILTIGTTSYDDNDYEIPSGHYEVALSTNRKFILLIQSGQAITCLPIINIINLEKTLKIAVTTSKKTEDNKILIIFKAEDKEYQALLKLP